MPEIRYFHSIAELGDLTEAVIYGAGERGRNLAKELQENGSTKVKGLLDTYSSGKLDGLPVCRPGEAPAEFLTTPVLVASLYQMEIIRTLTEIGCTDFQVQVIDSYEAVPYLIYEKFRSSPGIYVEAGANDGLLFSNTFLLEHFAGWRGLLVEPLPTAAAACRRNRPGSAVEQCALGKTAGSAKLIDRGLMSRLWAGQQANSEEQVLTVPLTPLSALLEEQGISDFDLLVLDVEGAEAEVLSGLDLESRRPRYVLLEEHSEHAHRLNSRQLGEMYSFVEKLSPRDSLYRRKEVSSQENG